MVIGVRIALLAASLTSNTVVDPATYQAVRYRLLGPSRGGRSTAVTGVPSRAYTFYMGTSGGLWKTEDAGASWTNVSDGFFASGSIGAVAVADSDPNVVFAGTGQACLRGNVAAGVGMYKSEDGGRTWRVSGLADVGQIAKIRIHPKDANLVYVAAVGRAFGPNPDRGVFRSKDGGRTWEKVLYISAKTGAVDLSMDAANPRILYAAAWTGQRKPWTIVSGSAESGLYRTSDGGDHWTKLSGGLPQGVVGRIGVAVSPADPDRVWALVEAAEGGGLYRSDDGGGTWTRLETNARRRLYQRTWYYQHIVADPRDRNRVYVMNVDSFVSEDGGKSFEEIHDLPHGDAHDLWINPNDTAVMIHANDGGGTVSLDRGKTWSTELNQPTAEIYNAAVDAAFPYNVYGAQQDNTTIRLPSRAPKSLTPYETWRDMGGCESGSIAVDPRDPDVVYAGCGYGGEITRRNLRTGQWRNVMAYAEMEVGQAPRDLKYRFNWNAPIRFSPHDPRTLYHCSQFVHRSTDEGQSWQVISPDLSRNDKVKQSYSGEPITYENTGVETNSNILSFEESPVTAGVLWAGSDDGLVHVSRDGGKNWENVTPPGLPEWAGVVSLELSRTNAGRATFAAVRHRMDDFRPMIYRTEDFGRTWKLLTGGTNGIPGDVPARVVREDPERRGLLYAGTERGVFVSFDDGAHWQPMQQNLPLVPVTDLRVHAGDLVVSTQGRSFWILDDLTPLREAPLARPAAPARLLPPRGAYRADQANRKPGSALGENPPYGAVFYYWLGTEPSAEVRLEISDAAGNPVQTFSSEGNAKPDPAEVFVMTSRPEGEKRLGKKAGLNRFVWDLRYPAVDIVPDAIVWGFTGGPAAPPGGYRATLRVGDFSETTPFRILADPRLTLTSQDYARQFALMRDMHRALDETYAAVRTARSVRAQAREVARRLADAGSDAGDVTRAADALAADLTAIENGLMQTKNEADQDVENFPTKLDNQLAYVYGLVGETDAAPTDGQIERFRDLRGQLDRVLARLAEATGSKLAAFNQAATRAGAAPVLAPR